MSEILKAGIRYVREHTLYNMMRSSPDFEDVKAALNERMGWSIELFRSCFTIHLTSGGSFFMLGALLFLFMAENMHIQYGRLSPAELKERAEHVGHATFALLFAVLDVGFVIVRVAALVALSGSSALAASLILIGMSPSVLPVLTYPASLFKRRKCESDAAAKMESGTVVDGTGTGAS